MLSLNDDEPTDLRGGAYCAEFNVQASGQPWIQAKTDVINMMYPGNEEPIAAIRECGITLPKSAKTADVEYGKFCTIEFERPEPQDFAKFIDDLFNQFYNAGPEYELSNKIFDMR